MTFYVPVVVVSAVVVAAGVPPTATVAGVTSAFPAARHGVVLPFPTRCGMGARFGFAFKLRRFKLSNC